MPWDTETYDLREERDRLLDEREEVADNLAGMDPENPAYDGLYRTGRQVDNRLQGVEWAIDEWDEPTVTLGAPNGGEWGELEDRIAEAETGDVTPGDGAGRVYLVAEGTVDAPYCDGDDSFRAQLAATGQLPLAYLKWAEARINELMSVGNGERRTFDALVAAKQPTPTEKSSETSPSA